MTLLAVTQTCSQAAAGSQTAAGSQAAGSALDGFGIRGGAIFVSQAVAVRQSVRPSDSSNKVLLILGRPASHADRYISYR